MKQKVNFILGTIELERDTVQMVQNRNLGGGGEARKCGTGERGEGTAPFPQSPPLPLPDYVIILIIPATLAPAIRSLSPQYERQSKLVILRH